MPIYYPPPEPLNYVPPTSAEALLDRYRDGQRFFEAAKLSGEKLGSVNLAKAHLKFADLSGADLHASNLRGVYLGSANLSEATLDYADLTFAIADQVNLSNASLRGANLTSAFLYKSTLVGADLSGALLIADISDSDVSGANLTGASLTPKGTRYNYGGAELWTESYFDLATCRGLDSVRFTNPQGLDDYLSEAFRYAHEPDTPEARFTPRFVESVIERIKQLRELYGPSDPPADLIKVINTISSELIVYLKGHPRALYDIQPRQFEELVAEILASFGWEVQLTPQTRDGGYDIFAISKDVSGCHTSWLIECKKYRAENKVGVEYARALYGVKADLRVANAMLATTSDFTNGTRQFKASRYDFDLRNYSDILEWINSYKAHPGGRLYIKDNRILIGDGHER